MPNWLPALFISAASVSVMYLMCVRPMRKRTRRMSAISSPVTPARSSPSPEFELHQLQAEVRLLRGAFDAPMDETDVRGSTRST